jgi:hypothetical protein
MRLIRTAGTVALAVMAGGCALPPLSLAAAKVQVHRQYSTTLDSCKKLTPVTGTIIKRSWRPSGERVIGALRESVAQAGGDSVVLLQTDSVGSEVIQHGIAYRCY